MLGHAALAEIVILYRQAHYGQLAQRQPRRIGEVEHTVQFRAQPLARCTATAKAAHQRLVQAKAAAARKSRTSRCSNEPLRCFAPASPQLRSQARRAAAEHIGRAPDGNQWMLQSWMASKIDPSLYPAAGDAVLGSSCALVAPALLPGGRGQNALFIMMANLAATSARRCIQPEEVGQQLLRPCIVELHHGEALFARHHLFRLWLLCRVSQFADSGAKYEAVNDPDTADARVEPSTYTITDGSYDVYRRSLWD
ncbi:unnamed protein product [Symbiodinium sp. CCMP2592]|nr:unnamed protein product [Symbiodinium sp. CCMP2592]